MFRQRSAHAASIASVALLSGMLAVLLFTSPAPAETTPARIRMTPIHRRTILLPVSGPEHAIYGQITALRLPLFKMRLRSGRELTVNAKPAIDRDSYSAPFFVGKYVLVKGRMDSSNTLQADDVTRQTRIDGATSLDR